MKFRRNLFARLNAGLAAVFMLIVIIYWLSHRQTTEVIQREIRQSNLQKLQLMKSDMDFKIEQMVSFSMILLNDSTVRQFASIPIDRMSYDQMVIRRAIQDKIVFQENISPQWKSSFAVYSTFNRDMLAAEFSSYDEEELRKNVTVHWTLRPDRKGGRSFYKYISDSIMHAGDPKDASVIIEAAFPESNIRTLLNQEALHGRGETLLYDPATGDWISSGGADEELTTSILSQLARKVDRQTGETFHYALESGEGKYAVTGVRSATLGWYIVDCTPLKEAMKPLGKANAFFYTVLVGLFALTLLMSFALHRNVLTPLKKLIGGLRSVQFGDYGVRLKWESDYQFSFVFERFNDMTRRIRELIEHVLMEQLRAKDAYVKQLQAQINPHFLYNCLGFIINMTEMQNSKAVVAMAHRLSDYYRYMTRTDVGTVTLREELELVRNYLDIQQMRFPRLDYEIDVAPEAEALDVPRLIVQPIVENAIVHGVARSARPASIRIAGGTEGKRVWLTVRDNGRGLDEQRLFRLQQTLQLQEEPEVGYGLWNTAQRLRMAFGDEAELTVAQAAEGGVVVRLEWTNGSAKSAETAERRRQE